MKNILLTSAIVAVMSYPASALDANNHIEPSPETDCVESTLGTATGPANLEADWTANTINLEWYNEDTKLTVPTTSNTCRYDGQITLPSTNPEKTGYTFRGWQVKVAGFDLSALFDSGPLHYCSGSKYDTLSVDACNDNMAWATEYGNGILKGIASCNNTPGDGESYENPIFRKIYNEEDIPTQPENAFNQNSTGRYCWCKATGVDPEKDGTYVDLHEVWVYGNIYDADENTTAEEACAESCRYVCGSDFS